MANIAGAGGGGSKYGQRTPPGNALLKKEANAQKKLGTGPSFSTGDVADVLGRFVKQTVNPPVNTVTIGGKTQRVQGAPVFNPLTLGIDALIHAPSQVKGLRQTGARIGSGDPTLTEKDILGFAVSGGLGFPRGGTYEPKGTSTGGFTPRVVRGKTTPETAGELGKQVREGLRGAKTARVEQDKLYSEERGKRAAGAAEAMRDLGGVAGYQKALGELRGELPKLQFGGFENFDQAGLDALFTHIQDHPTLRPYEKIRTQAALENALRGRVPTKSELRLLGHVFGKEVSNRIAASVPAFAKAKNIGLELLNVPRAIMSSFDLSAPFRQGLVAGAAHPRIFFKNFAPMVKSYGSEKVYQSVMDDIATRPTFQAMKDSGLALTDLENISQREEQFVGGNYAEKIPGVGRGVRASGRAYVAFLTKTRADVFDFLLQSAETQGIDIKDPKVVESIARYVNSATGRGSLGAAQKHAVTLNTLFFSPRLLASRVNFLNPVYYAKLDPFARRQALKAMRNLVGVVGLTLFLAKMSGAQVNADPRNADFAKMKFGNTRIDLLGGFQQPVRLVAQLFSGKIVSSTTGKTLSLGPQGPGKLSRYDIAQRFVESKLAPVPSFVKDVGKQTDSVGQPLHWDFSFNNPAFQRMLPLLAQDAASLYQDTGSIPAALGGYALGGLGVGIQTYGPKKPTGGGTSGGYGRGHSGGSRYGRSRSSGSGYGR